MRSIYHIIWQEQGGSGANAKTNTPSSNKHSRLPPALIKSLLLLAQISERSHHHPAGGAHHF